MCALWEEFGQNFGNSKQDVGRRDLARIRRGRGLRRAEMEEFALMLATVFVSEESDVDFETMVEWWTGRFFCSLQGPGSVFEDGPSEVTVDEAIAWGRKRAGRVLVRVGSDDHYSAGSDLIKGTAVKPWPAGGISLDRRMLPDQEHLLRSESDPPILWNVVVAVSGKGMDQPNARTRLMEALDADQAPADANPNPGFVLRITAPTARQAEQEAKAAVAKAYGALAKGAGPHAFSISMTSRPAPFKGL
jgi:hypothetical protein